MDTKDFLSLFLRDEGWYSLFGYAGKSSSKSGAPIQKLYEDVDSLVANAEKLDARGVNCFFGLACFKTGENRTAKNVKSLRSFHLDIDVGEKYVPKDAGYATKDIALRELKRTVDELGLPRPYIVNSGNGLHVYWVLTEAVSVDVWKPVALKFKDRLGQVGLLADPAVPADPARVLRIPGTHNHKSTPPKKVELLRCDDVEHISFEDFTAAIGAGDTKVSDDPADIFAQAKKASGVMNLIASSSVNDFNRIVEKTKLGRGCAQLEYVIRNQSEVSEPMWRAGLSIAKFCEDGDKFAHALSRRHPDYDPGETAKKLRGIQGPYLCETFDSERPGVCKDCIHWRKISSPVQLGKKVAVSEGETVVIAKGAGHDMLPEQEYVIPAYPVPYLRAENGGIYKLVQTKDEDGEVVDQEEQLVYHNDMYCTKTIEDPDQGFSVVIRLHLPMDGIKEFTVPIKTIGAKDKFREILGHHGVAVNRVEELVSYTNKWVNELQSKQTAVEARLQFGWTDSACSSFAIGALDIFPESIEINPPCSFTSQYFHMFTPAGTYEEWRKTMDFFAGQGMEAHQYMIGRAYGSVLMEFLPVNGCTFHMHSTKSGHGKSTAMYAGASVYGKPKELVIEAKDTANHTFNRMERVKDLAVYVDELTNMPPRAASEFAYGVTSGKQRGRMSQSQNKERTRGEEWSLLVGTTSNASLLQTLSAHSSASMGEAQRVLEWSVPKTYFGSKTESDEMTRKLKNNYGHAFPIYIKHVMNNLEATKDLLFSVQQKLDSKFKLVAANRFWSADFAATITGLIIARRCELHDFHIQNIVEWIEGSLLPHNRAFYDSLQSNAASIILEYYMGNVGKFLRIKSVSDSRVPGAAEDIILPDADAKNEILGRYETDTKLLFIRPRPFQRWCAEHRYEATDVIKDLSDSPIYKAKRVNLRLMRGTKQPQTSSRAYCIDLSTVIHDDAPEEETDSTET